MKHLITTIFALFLLTSNVVFAAEEHELVTWQVFMLPVARDNSEALQLLLKKEGANLSGAPVDITVKQYRYQSFTSEDLAKIDAAAIKALDQFGFKGYEWSNIQNAVIDEPNHCIIYYPSVNYKTFKVQEPYVWVQTDKLPGTLKNSLDSLGWSSGDQKNITLATKIDLATPKNFEDAIWHVFLLPCYKDGQDVKYLLENNLGIKIDISELTEKDFWTQDTKNIDEKLAQKMLSMGFQKSEWIKKDTDSYRDPNLRVMIYCPVARPKTVGGNFAWGKIDEKTGPDKFKDMLKSTGWPSAKDDKETLLELITKRVPLLYWTGTIYIAKDKGAWNIYLPTPLLFTSSSAESEAGADILLHAKLNNLEAINFVYNDAVKTDPTYTPIPADPFSPTNVPVGFAYTDLLKTKLLELIKLGTTYLENRLMTNFSGALKTLVKA